MMKKLLLRSLWMACMATLLCTPRLQAAVPCDSNATAPVLTADTVCGFGTVTLTALSPYPVNWYINGNQLIGTGSTLARNISATTTFYARAVTGTNNESVGLADNSAGGGYSLAGANLQFNVNTPCTLNGVYVYPEEEGNVVINLLDASENILQTFSQPVSAGDIGIKTFIPLNLNLSPGTYALGQDEATSVSMFRNNSGVSYPYTTPSGSISITGNSIDPALYYFFYDWQVTTQCISPADSIEAVVLPAAPIAATSNMDTFCQGLIASLSVTSANGSYTYTWSGGPVAPPLGPVVTAGPGSTTQYVVQAIDTANCRATDTLLLVVNVLQDVELTVSDDSICPGETVQINATDWTQPLVFEDTTDLAIPDGDMDGVISSINITGTGLTIGGNTTLESVCLNIEHPYDGDLIIGLVSPNGRVLPLSLNNGDNGANYTNTCFTADAATDITAGSAPFTGAFLPQDPAGLAIFDGETVDGSWKLFIADAASDDAGTLLNWAMTIQVNGLTYTWSSTPAGLTASTTSVTVTPQVTTNYQLTLSDTVSGCSRQFAATVMVYTPVSVAALGDTTVCAGQPVVLVPVISGGDGNYTYNWSNGSNTPTTTVLAPGTYTVTVTGNCGDSAVVSSVIHHRPVLGVNASADTAICPGMNVEITALATGGDSTYTYAWSNSAGNVTGTVVAPLITTTYLVTVTDGCGNSAIDSVKVTVNDVPVVSLGADTTQCGGSILLDAGNGGATYAWSTADNTGTITVSSSAHYSVTVTNAGGCTATDDINVVINTLPIVDLGNDIVQCGDTVTLDAGNGATAYLWNTGETTENIEVDTTGTYSVIVTGANGCTATDTVAITITAQLIVDLGFDVVQCGSSVTLNAGISGATYTWNTAETTQVISVTTSGVYAVTVQGTNGCQGTDAINVTIYTPPVVNLGNDVEQCAGSVTLDAENTGLTYTWNTSDNSQTITVSASGVYSVTVRDANQCTATDTVIVTIHTLPVVDLGPDTTQCGGSILLGTISGPFTYLWNTTETTATIAVDTMGTYAVTVTDNNNCSSTDSIMVTFNAAPVVDLGSDIGQCGGAVALDAGNAGLGFEWSTAETTQIISVTASGTYTVTVTDTNGCTGSDAVLVTINPLPVVDLGNDSAQCGGSITLDAGNAGAAYLWSTGATTQTLNVSAGGTYGVTVTGLNTCTATDEVNITINAAATVNLGNDTAYCGGSVTLDAGNTGATYLWSTSETNSAITVASSGLYSVTVTYAGGCTAADEISVTINTLPSVELGADTTQCGGTVTLDAGNPGAAFEWSTNETTAVITAGASATYVVTVTDANGCTATDSIAVTINAMPAVNLGNDTALCSGSVTLNAGNAGAGFEWSGGETTASIVVSSAGTYSVTVTDANNCTATDDIQVTYNSSLTVNLGGDVTQCGGSVMLDAANAGLSFEWSTAETTQVINVTASGTYTVTVTDGGSCTGTDEIDVTIYQLPVVNLGNDVTQCGDSVTLDAGNAGSTYNWSTLETSQTITVSSSAQVEVTVTDANNCSAADTVLVAINAIPVVNLGADVARCGGSVTLNAGNAGAGYEWSNAETTQTVTASVTGDYAVTVTSADNCTASDTVTITIYSFPTVNLGADVTLCADSVTLDAGNAGVGFQWSVANATTQTISVGASGNYSVTVTDANNCTGSDAVVVIVNVPPVVNLGADITQCGGTVTLDAGNAGAAYAWSNQDTTQTISVSAAGTYQVTITDLNTSCTATDTVAVIINALPVVNLGADVMQCGGAVILDAGNAGAGFAWSNSATTQTTSVNSSGAYSVTVTAVGVNCSAADTVNVTINTPPTATLTLPADTLCNNAAALTLSGGLPAGGTYFGNGIANGSFNPATAGNGSTTVSYIYTDGNGCADTATAVIVVKVCTGINEISGAAISVYPNPANGYVNLKAEGISGDLDISLFDVSGRLVQGWHDAATGTVYTRGLDVSEFSAGTYTLVLKANEGTAAYKLILQR